MKKFIVAVLVVALAAVAGCKKEEKAASGVEGAKQAQISSVKTK